MRLWILGDGSERTSLEALAHRLGIPIGANAAAGAVEFAGWLPQANCADRLAQADVLVLPSLLECGGAVVLEAMSLGKPVIATAWGGPLDYLDQSCGILIEPTSAEAITRGLVAAMVELAGSSSKGRAMGQSGLARVQREFDWRLKGERILGVYSDAIVRARGSAAARA